MTKPRVLAPCLALALLMFVVGTVLPATTAHGAPAAAKKCTKKHGKRVCKKKKKNAPRITIISGYSICGVTEDPSADCKDYGFIWFQNDSLTRVKRVSDGQSVELSNWNVGPDGKGGYSIYMHVVMSKGIPGETDHRPIPSGPASFVFGDANRANDQAFGTSSCPKSISPGLPTRTLQDGDSNSGWICTPSLDSKRVLDTFTVYYETGLDTHLELALASLRIGTTTNCDPWPGPCSPQLSVRIGAR